MWRLLDTVLIGQVRDALSVQLIAAVDAASVDAGDDGGDSDWPSQLLWHRLSSDTGKHIEDDISD